MCSANAADLAALESLELMIRELLAEQLLECTRAANTAEIRMLSGAHHSATPFSLYTLLILIGVFNLKKD